MITHWVIGQRGALTRRKYARRREWRVRTIVEERVRPREPTQPPAEKRWRGERRARASAVEARSAGAAECGALEDSAKGRAEHLISRSAVGIMAHESMNEAHDREARAGSVGDRSPAAIGVPAEDLAGEMQAAHGIRASGKLHAARWHMEDVCPARCIEHVPPIENVRKRLAVLAVADETKAAVRRNFVRDAAHVSAPAAKRELLCGLRHKTQFVSPRRWVDCEDLRLRRLGDRSSSGQRRRFVFCRRQCFLLSSREAVATRSASS
jgi:hypothetical protein